MNTTVFVCTLSPAGKRWSRYVFPFAIEHFTQLGNDLVIRSGDVVRKVVPSAVTDEVDSEGVNFPGSVQWNFIDLGAPGRDKMLEGFDITAEGTPSVSVGYDQRDLSAFSDAIEVDPDTVPGAIIALPMQAPSFMPKVTFEGGEAWAVIALTLYPLGSGGP